MSLLDRIENLLNRFFALLFKRENAPDDRERGSTDEANMADTKPYRKLNLDAVKEESTTRVYCRIPDPETTITREFLSVSERPLVRFEVIQGRDKEAAFEFGESQGIIGRSSGSMIELSDPNVSRKHARLDIKKTQTVIYDNASTNGTKVNGRRITKQVLRSGDVISMGQTMLRFTVIRRDKTGRGAGAGTGTGSRTGAGTGTKVNTNSQKRKGRR